MPLPGWARELRLMGRSYVRGVYPTFVYGNAAGRDTLPIFFFHEVTPESFRRQLRYLRDNGYTGVDCDTAVRVLDGTAVAAERPVVLTFDDGLASLYDVVWPLLAEFQVRAVAYIVPAWVGTPGFLTWDQCRAMHDTGWVDVQSHSHAHRAVITGMAVTGWWDRRTAAAPPWGVPGMRPAFLERGVEHFPVLEGRSLFEADRAVYLPDAVWDDWSRTENGASVENTASVGPRFAALLTRHADAITFSGPDELYEEMRADLTASRDAIACALPGHIVRHFAFPWHANAAPAWAALEAAGFVTGAVGLPSPDGTDPPTGGVRRLFRVNGDFVECLPGEGRRPFARVVARKVLRRVRATAGGGS